MIKILWTIDELDNYGVDDKGRVWKLSPLRQIREVCHMGYTGYYRIQRKWYSKRQINERSVELKTPLTIREKKVPFKNSSKKCR